MQTPESPSLLNDSPSETDLLDYDSFASALFNIIQTQNFNSTFVLGIFGQWGTGKSTLMKMLEKKLDNENIVTLYFSAWAYNKEEHIWAAFLQSIMTRLIGRLSFIQKLVLSFKTFMRSINGTKLLENVPKIAIQIILICIPVLFGRLLATNSGSLFTSTFVQTGSVLASTYLAVLYFLKPIASVVWNNGVSDLIGGNQVDFEKHIGNLDHFRKRFTDIIAALPGRERRTVIFIDDLDRCGSDKVLDILDSIKVFLDVPNCIFVIGMDLSIVRSALEIRYPNNLIAQKDYLDKIIQLPFYLPMLSEEDLKVYIKGLKVEFPDIRCQNVFIVAPSHNPREIKRLINTYFLNWYLAQARNIGRSITSVRLAKIVIIQQLFITLFDLLKKDPSLLADLEKVFRDRLGETSQPDFESFEKTRIFNPIDNESIDNNSSVDGRFSSFGLSYPPALESYVHNSTLGKLLTMHDLEYDNDEVNFLFLSVEEIEIYFTLVLRAGVSESSSERKPYQLSVTDRNSDHNYPYFGNLYRVLDVLGEGGLSKVYCVFDERRARKVSLKTLLPSLANSNFWNMMFDKEMQVLQKLTVHPHIVEFYDKGQYLESEITIPFYTMEYLSKGSLRDLLQTKRILDFHELGELVIPIFDALEYIHNNDFTHGDIKPSAILYNDNWVPKLSDFSLAQEPPNPDRTQFFSDNYIGTIPFMSPEQLGQGTLDYRSDLFSFGIVLFLCLTGENPFSQHAKSDHEIAFNIKNGIFKMPSTILTNLPPTLDDYMKKLLSPNKGDRFQSSRLAKQALVRALDLTVINSLN